MAPPTFNPNRRSTRQKGITPIALVTGPIERRITVPAVSVDISSHGLRIHSPAYLISGQRIQVRFSGDPAISVSCQVEWTKSAGTLRPCEAGLSFLNPGLEIPPCNEETVITEPPAMAA